MEKVLTPSPPYRKFHKFNFFFKWSLPLHLTVFVLMSVCFLVLLFNWLYVFCLFLCCFLFIGNTIKFFCLWMTNCPLANISLCTSTVGRSYMPSSKINYNVSGKHILWFIICHRPGIWDDTFRIFICHLVCLSVRDIFTSNLPS